MCQGGAWEKRMQITTLQQADPAGGRSGPSGLTASLPKRFDNVEQLDHFLSSPDDALVADLARRPG